MEVNMGILPIKKCNTCDYVFSSPGITKKMTCPRCGSKMITEPSAADIAYHKKNKNK